MTKTINSEELRALIQGKTEFLLVDVLPKDKFAQDHIEGALNVPMDSPDSLKTIEWAAGAKKKKIVAYCGKSPCESSKRIARQLTEAGHTDVLCYEGGVARWRQEVGKSGAAQADKSPAVAATRVGQKTTTATSTASAAAGGLVAVEGAGANGSTNAISTPASRGAVDTQGQTQPPRNPK